MQSVRELLNIRYLLGIVYIIDYLAIYDFNIRNYKTRSFIDSSLFLKLRLWLYIYGEFMTIAAITSIVSSTVLGIFSGLGQLSKYEVVLRDNITKEVR